MTNYQRQALIMGMKILNQLILLFCFFMALAAVSHDIESISFSQFLSLRIKLVNFMLYAGFAFFWYMDFWIFGLYHSRRFAYWKSDLADIGLCSAGPQGLAGARLVQMQPGIN